MEKITRRSQLQVGFYLIDDTNILHRILEILAEETEAFGRPSIVSVEWGSNTPQKLSFDTLKEWHIFDPDENPEYLL